MTPMFRQPRSKFVRKLPMQQKLVTQDGEVYNYSFKGGLHFIFSHFIK